MGLYTQVEYAWSTREESMSWWDLYTGEGGGLHTNFVLNECKEGEIELK